MPTKYHYFACFRMSTYLFVLFICLYVQSVQLEIHSPENTDKVTDVLHFILYLSPRFFLKKAKEILLSTPSVRLSVMLSPPKPLDEIQPNLVCELLT